MYWTYILQSEINGSYYVGCTHNIEERLLQHNKGFSKYTSKYKPWKVVYTEAYSTLSAATKREYQIKSWKKREQIEKLVHGTELL